MLQAIQEQTAALVAGQLRSHALVVSRLLHPIAAALREGVSHKAIHAAIKAGGLSIGWNNYRVALYRARSSTRRPMPADTGARQEGRATNDAVAQNTVGTASAPPLPQRRLAVPPAESEFTGSAIATSRPSNTLGVVAALQQARRKAASTDYGSIGRARYRERERQSKLKESR